MAPFGYLVVALFLPLFPASMLFNRLFARIGNAWWRMVLLLLWPQLGLLALANLAERPPAWVVYWAVSTACLYAFRAVAVRELGLWTAYMATSAWALLWVVAMSARSESLLILQTIGFSAPFLLLAWLVSRLESGYGAAYSGTYGGLAMTAPRTSLVLVLSLLAAVGTPPFPAFFTLLSTTTQALAVVPGAALMMLIVWLLWAWAGSQMTRGMVVGPAVEAGPDLGTAATVPSLIALVVLAVAGVSSMGYLA